MSNEESNKESTPLNGASVENVDLFATLVAAESQDQIVDNWKWILLAGGVNIATGLVCLIFPIFATTVAEVVLVCTVLISGVFHIVAGFYAKHGQKSYLWGLGALQALLALLMYMHPVLTLTLLTILVAILFGVLGGLRLLVVTGNPNMPHRTLTAISGILTIAMSIIICITMPLAKWYTIGVLIGVNLINIGGARIGLGMYGRQLAQSGNYQQLPS